MLGNALSYLYNILITRVVTADYYGTTAYGDFFVLSTLVFYLAIPVSALGGLATKVSADLYAKNEPAKLLNFVQRITKKLIWLSLALTIIGIALTPLLQSVFKLNDPLAIILAILGFTLTLPSSVILGVMTGLHKFGDQAIVTILNGIFRVATGVVFGMVWGVKGAILGGVAAALVNLVFVAFFYYRWRKIELKTVVNPGQNSYKFPFSLLAASVLSALALGSFLSIDVFVVKYLFTGVPFPGTDIDQPSAFSGLSLFGRIIYFIIVTLATIILPLASYSHASGGKSKRVLWRLCLVATSLGLPIIIILYMIPEPLIRLVLGADYVPTAALMGHYALSVFMFSLAALFNNYALATNKLRITMLPLLFSVIQLLLVIVTPVDLGGFVYIKLVVSFTMLAIYLFAALVERPDKQLSADLAVKTVEISAV
jgi:O-antigen/teichoic acid export membrane protein